MSDSFTDPASVSQDIIRTLFSAIDRPAYWLLGLVYELFFNVASADLFSNDTIMKFYGRVQVILGVFMMFQLAMTILKGIVNPDTFVSKDKGIGNFVTRVVTSLILITILMPISIPTPKNEYEIQINNNGLLFGTLYSLQHRILANNTLGRLVLGTSGDNTFVASDSSKDTELKKSARIFTSTILKGFYRINLVPEDQRDTTYIREGKDPAAYNANRVCKDIDDEVLAAYTRVDADPGEIISLVNATCDSDAKPGFLNSAWTGIQKLTGTTKYVFAYMPVISTIVAVVFVFILLSFTIDVSVRAVKLAVLRLIAPIPIIAYMDPKGGKDSAFNSWVKTLTSTYLDIFIRLAVVYFVIFLIQDMIINGIVIDVGTGVLGVVSHIVIWIGLFIFAKQAPKFIKQVLGMKDEGGKLFGGFGEMLAVGAVGAGAIGGAVSRGVGSMENHHNFGRALLAGITGGIGGGVNAGRTLLNSKDANAANIMKANRAYNARNYSNEADESTLGGRMLAGMQGAVGARTASQIMDNKIKDYGAATAAWKRINTALDSDDNAITYTGPSVTDSRGNVLLQSGNSYSAKAANDILSRMKSSGQYSAAEIEAMEDAKKAIQKSRFDDIRTRGASGTTLHGTEAQIFQGAKSIYDIGKKYENDRDEVFKEFKHASSVDDASINMGRDFKGASYNAERQADAIKNSSEYARAQANAKRADEKK